MPLFELGRSESAAASREDSPEVGPAVWATELTLMDVAANKKDQAIFSKRLIMSSSIGSFFMGKTNGACVNDSPIGGKLNGG